MNSCKLDTPRPKSSNQRLKMHCQIPARQREPQLLCVDDDPSIATAIEMHLRPYAIQVERAFYGMQGFWESVRNHPDLIIMDLAMPNGDGHYFLECLKRNDQTADIPVIVLTGLRDPQRKAEVMQAGADVFLRKPTSFDTLLHNISRFVDVRHRNTDAT